MDPCPHCLRPTFTARLGTDLDRGAALNLVAAPGQGAGRLLEDLKRLPGRGPRLVANLKKHRASLAGLIADLWRQTGLDGHPPTTLGGLSDRLVREAPGAALLLHRFDALLDNPDLDPGYNDRFIDALNALRNRGLALICVSAERLQPHVILTPKGVRHGSTLDLTCEDMPALGHGEIVAEVERRAPPLDGGGRALLAAAVLADPCPMDLLDLACRRLRNGQHRHLALNERLARWGGELKAERGRIGPRSAVRVRHQVQTWWVASGVGKVLPVGRVAAWICGLVPGCGKKRG